MAGNDDRYRVAAQGTTDGPRCPWSGDVCRKLTVGPCDTVGNPTQCLPDLLLKRSSLQMNFHVDIDLLTREVGIEERDNAVE